MLRHLCFDSLIRACALIDCCRLLKVSALIAPVPDELIRSETEVRPTHRRCSAWWHCYVTVVSDLANGLRYESLTPRTRPQSPALREDHDPDRTCHW